MELSFVLIEEDNRESFDTVFPDGIELDENRVAVAAVDEEGYVLGSVSYRVVDFEYDIDWLFVEPSVRRQGVGSGLIEQVLKVVVMSGERLPVTASFEFGTENRELHSFFLSCRNMMTHYSHERYYVSPEEIKSADALHRAVKAEHEVVRFFDKSENEQKMILGMLSKQQGYVVNDYESWKEECVPQLCQCIYINNSLVDLIIMKQKLPGTLELSYLYGKYPRGLIELLGSTVTKMEALFPGTNLTFDAVTEESKELADHLFPGAKTTHIYEAEF